MRENRRQKIEGRRLLRATSDGGDLSTLINGKDAREMGALVALADL